MKATTLMIIFFISIGGIFCQKNMRVGDKSVLIKGENIYSFEEVLLDEYTSKWVEVYLFNSEDSIIVSEIQKPSSKSEICETVFIYSVAKNNIDFIKTSVEQHNSHLEKPKTLYKVHLHTIDFADKVKTDSYYVKDYQSSNIHDLRILVRDINQGIAIKNKLAEK